MQVGMAKVNQQLLLFVEAKNFFKSNDPILIHCVDEGKTIDHNYNIDIAWSLLLTKQRRSTGMKYARSLTLLII